MGVTLNGNPANIKQFYNQQTAETDNNSAHASENEFYKSSKDLNDTAVTPVSNPETEKLHEAISKENCHITYVVLDTELEETDDEAPVADASSDVDSIGDFAESYVGFNPLLNSGNTEEPVTFGPGNDKGEFDAQQIQEMRHEFSDEQISDFMESSSVLKNNPNILNDFLKAISSAVRTQYGNSQNVDIPKLTYKIALEFTQFEFQGKDKFITFDSLIEFLYNKGKGNELEAYFKGMILGTQMYRNYSFSNMASQVVKDLQVVFPNMTEGRIAQIPELVNRIKELNNDFLGRLSMVKNLPDGEEKNAILKEIYELRDLIDEKTDEFTECLEAITAMPEYQEKASPKLRAGVMSLGIDVLDISNQLEEIDNNENIPQNEKAGKGGHRTGRRLKKWLMNQLKKDKEAAMLLSASAKETLQKLMPEMLTNALEANHGEELSLALSLIQQNQKYAQYTIDDVMKRIIEYSNKIAEFIKAKNEQINLEELLNEKRNEFDELEIFNLPEPVLKTISDILGINAKYLDPAKLRVEIEKMQIKVA